VIMPVPGWSWFDDDNRVVKEYVGFGE